MKKRQRRATKAKRRKASKGTRRRGAFTAGLKKRVAVLSRERDEAFAQQTATSEVLRVISSSPGDLEPVFNSMLQNATRICEAKFGVLYRYDGSEFHLGALLGAPPALTEFQRQRGAFKPPPGTPLDRLLRTKKVIRTADDSAEETPSPSARLAGAKSHIAVPMFKDDELAGAIVIYRQEVRPFTDKQVELVQNFAAQAVIAIENARLLNELRQRTADLSESLEQQTATSEVLQVISASPGDLTPVFDAMLENAMRICHAKFGGLFRVEDGMVRRVATVGVPAPLAKALQNLRPMPINPLCRVIATGETIHMDDYRLDQAYLEREPVAVAGIELGGIRTLLLVPMIKDDERIGIVAIFRQHVEPFSEKQIELLQNFAAQAVIAIENTRLLNELRQRTDDLSEALEQQTATSEVLKVISSSPGELEPVFRAMLENATRICEAKFGTLHYLDGKNFNFAADYGTPPALVEFQKQRGPFLPEAGSLLDRLLQTNQVAQSADYAAEPIQGPPVTLGGARSTVAVPMLKNNKLVGAIVIYRQEVRPFAEKQVDLVKNFAAQAVIAIENARLLSELRESLQQQTATSDVLKVISRSTFDLPAVLNTLVESAARLCGADKAQILRPSNHEHSFYAAASYGYTPEYDEYLSKLTFAPGREGVVGRVLLERKPVQIADVLADPDYKLRETQRLGGFRTHLGLPLLREGSPIGILVVSRAIVQPFDDKHIELLATFADQAVIAIENVRLFDDVQKRTRELSESLEQQTATAGILSVISNSLTDTQPVFDAIVQSALKLFSDSAISLVLRDGGQVRGVAINESDPVRAEAWRMKFPVPLTREYLNSTAILDATIVDIPDVRTAPPELAAGARNFAESGYEAVTSVPLMRGDVAIGALSVMRLVPGGLSEKQLALVKTFASQAVIAIENSRLFNELHQRTDDLSESLEQQTATAEVLKVISGSPGELDPVFQAMLSNATRICEANFGVIFGYADGKFRALSSLGVPPEFDAYLQASRVWGPETGLGQVARTKKAFHIADIRDGLPYTERDPNRLASVEIGGVRTFIGVPLLKDGELIGVLSIYRQEVRPFSNKQIELVDNFARQAVIAIDNARLLNEVRESLQQQTATADVLKVISRSTFDLQTVLQTLVESAARLSDADKANITREKDGSFYRAEAYGFSREFMDFVRDVPIKPERGSAFGRALLEGRAVHIPDVQADPEYTWLEAQKLGDFRTVLAVPMLREGLPIGVLTLTRSDVRPFTNRQIELVTTFADQAAIAIENVRLFDSVEARTRELTKSLADLQTAQDRLVQTEKLASLGQLTAGIAHEIKNPLNFVNNFSAVSIELIDELREALNSAPLDAKLRAEVVEIADMLQGNLDKVVQHGKRADSIVKNMLLHSRQGSGEHRPVDINGVVEESLNLAYHGARAEKQGFNITLEKSFDPAAGEVDLFPQEITRVLLNLISNGFYAATKRKGEANEGNYEPTLAAATKNLGDSVEIRIRDNGTGIPPEVKEKMFDPFFTTKPAGEGTGLGLSLSYDIIVKQHAGSIEVDTKPGEFTEFRIVLPRSGATMAKSGARV